MRDVANKELRDKSRLDELTALVSEKGLVFGKAQEKWSAAFEASEQIPKEHRERVAQLLVKPGEAFKELVGALRSEIGLAEAPAR